ARGRLGGAQCLGHGAGRQQRHRGLSDEVLGHVEYGAACLDELEGGSLQMGDGFRHLVDAVAALAAVAAVAAFAAVRHPPPSPAGLPAAVEAKLTSSPSSRSTAPVTSRRRNASGNTIDLRWGPTRTRSSSSRRPTSNSSRSANGNDSHSTCDSPRLTTRSGSPSWSRASGRRSP